MRSAVLRPSSRSIAIVLLLASTPALSSCAFLERIISEPSSEPPLVVTLARCPPLETYTPTNQKRAAEELRALPKDSVIAGMVGDYGTLRGKCREYEKKKSTAE